MVPQKSRPILVANSSSSHHRRSAPINMAFSDTASEESFSSISTSLSSAKNKRIAVVPAPLGDYAPNVVSLDDYAARHNHPAHVSGSLSSSASASVVAPGKKNRIVVSTSPSMLEAGRTPSVKVRATHAPKKPIVADPALAEDAAAAAAAAAASSGICQHCRQHLGHKSSASDAQLNDRTMRKMMDLEISNTSLLAVNASLESTIRQQAQSIERLKRKLERRRRDSGGEPSEEELDSVRSEENPASPSSEPSDDCTYETMAAEASAAPAESVQSPEPAEDVGSNEPELDPNVELIYSRICLTFKQLIDDAERAVHYRAPLSIVPEEERPRREKLSFENSATWHWMNSRANVPVGGDVSDDYTQSDQESIAGSVPPASLMDVSFVDVPPPAEMSTSPPTSTPSMSRQKSKVSTLSSALKSRSGDPLVSKKKSSEHNSTTATITATPLKKKSSWPQASTGPSTTSLSSSPSPSSSPLTSASAAVRGGAKSLTGLFSKPHSARTGTVGRLTSSGGVTPQRIRSSAGGNQLAGSAASPSARQASAGEYPAGGSAQQLDPKATALLKERLETAMVLHGITETTYPDAGTLGNDGFVSIPTEILDQFVQLLAANGKPSLQSAHQPVIKSKKPAPSTGHYLDDPYLDLDSHHKRQ